MTINIPNLRDTDDIAERMAWKFDLDDNQVSDFAVTLPAFRPERFSLPYADGAELALQRPFGVELRALTGRDDLHMQDLASRDADTFECAGHLDFFDRHGMRAGWALIQAASDAEGQLPLTNVTRTEPIDPLKILILMRDALAGLYSKYSGRSPSRSDIRRVGILQRPVVVPGSCADFVKTALNSLGWSFTDAEIAKNYSLVVGTPWRNRNRG